MAILLKYLALIEEMELCIQPVGGMLVIKEAPVAESMNDTSPYFWNLRLIFEFTGVFTDDTLKYCGTK